MASAPDLDALLNERVQVEPTERHNVEYLADMYAVITALERLERANNRDLVTHADYQESLAKLIARFDAVDRQLALSYQSRYRGYRAFIDDYDMSASSAAALARISAIMHQREEAQKNQEPQHTVHPQEVLEATQHFITVMDSIKLGQTAADQLHPIVDDLIVAVRRVAPGFEMLPKLQLWMSKLDHMRASEQLTEEDAREMIYDVDRGYQAFHRFLGSR